MVAGGLALVAAAFFAGAALYVSLAEHPARLTLPDGAALAQWKPSYERGAAMQGTLAMAGSILALIAWLSSDHALWLIGAILLFANWPVTMLVIMPVNRALKAIDPEQPIPEIRSLLDRWGRLHAVRTLLGLASAALMAAASLG